ncbi:MAG: GNAT family N-acetyltransferase [Candidatus Bathyarchaeota archaeon]|nr:GNAT family N-acetyltransferase [Candidatus Bathyarchaeota archaeon]
MSNQIMIRRAEKSDLKTLYDIEVECFHEDAFPLHFMEQFIEDSKFITLVAILENKIVGFITASIEIYKGERVGHVYSINVKPEYRRRGVGSHLLKSMEENLRRSGARACYLEARKDNVAAVNLYLKHKYVTVSILRNYYGAGRDGIRFMKVL